MNRLMNNLNISGWKYSSSAPALAYPPTIRLLLMDCNQISRAQTKLVVQICRILINSSTLFRSIGFATRFGSVHILIVIILGMTAEFVKIAKVILVRWIFRVSIPSCSIGPVTTFGVMILYEMDIYLVFVVLNLERFVPCPRRDLFVKRVYAYFFSIWTREHITYVNRKIFFTLRTLCCKPCLSLETKMCSANGCFIRLLPSTSANVPPTLYLAASRYTDMERI